MQITGKLIKISQVETGTSNSGTIWKKQSITVENDAYFKTPVYFTVFGDKLADKSISIGEKITVDFEIESKESNGKWYTNFRVFYIIVFNEKDEVFKTIIIGNRPEYIL